MTFLVTAIDAQGVRRNFEREADDASTLRAALKDEGVVVISVVESGTGEAGRGKRPLSLFTLSLLDAEMGLRQISAMLRGGVTLIVALDAVAEQAMSKAARKMWKAVAHAIEAGSTFADALSPYSKRIGEITVPMAAIGERTGELAKTLSRAADQLEGQRSLRTTVVNALAYPVLAVVMAFGVSAYLVVGVIPKLAEFLRSGGVTLPPITQMLMDFSDYVRFNGLGILAGIGLVIAAWIALRLIPVTHEIQDVFLLRLPIVGRILRLSATALFSRSMQIMTEAGVTLVDALDTAAALLSNRRIRRRVRKIAADVVKGGALGEALAEAREFMPMLRSMAAIGEHSGAMPEAFGETARFHEMMLAHAVKRFGMLIEPVMICVTGAIVGFVYIAFFVALFAIAGMN